MRISLEWVCDFVTLPADRTPRQLAHDLTVKTVEVEGIELIDDDVIFEIDNKSLTNRPDLWGHYGIAREFAAIYGLELRPLPTVPEPVVVDHLVGEVDPAVCSRFAAVAFTMDTQGEAPEYIRRRLTRIGESTINCCVDLSNYVMFTVGQPNHVWDADLIHGRLHARRNTHRHLLPLVASEPVELPEGVPVIVDDHTILGVAGIMGGESSSIQPTTNRIVLEVATFNPQAIRRASQRLSLRTESSARYEKGLDTQRVDQAINLFIHLLGTLTPKATIIGMHDTVVTATPNTNVTVDRSFLDTRIGQRLDTNEIVTTLDALGFEAIVDDAIVEVTVPTWRSTGDVSLPHDILEELARIHGYDQLPSATIPVVLSPVRSLNRIPLDRRLREQLAARGGLHEVITYPWVADHLLAACGYPKDGTVHIEGASAPDRNALRPALLPNLLEAIFSNLHNRPTMRIFEVGTVFPYGAAEPYRGRFEVIPSMVKSLGLALVADEPGETLFRQAKGLLDMLRRHCFLTDLTLAGPTDATWADPTARVGVQVNDTQIGSLALLRPWVLRQAGIDGVQVAYAEFDLTAITAHRSRDNRFVAIPALPESSFDLSVVLADTVTWGMVQEIVGKADPLIASVDYIGEYRPDGLSEGRRSVTVRLTLQPRDATLTREDITAVRTNVLSLLEREFSATLR